MLEGVVEGLELSGVGAGLCGDGGGEGGGVVVVGGVRR